MAGAASPGGTARRSGVLVALRAAAPWLVAVPLAAAAIEASGLDLAVQDRIFALGGGAWPVDAGEPVGRLVFYDRIKALIVGLGAVLVAAMLASFLPAPRLCRLAGLADRRAALVGAVLVAAATPLAAGGLKALTDVHCPSQIDRYGGRWPYDGPVEKLLGRAAGDGTGRCFPAGHASGGFGLVGLGLLASDPAWRRRALALGLGAGTLMGGYQMLKGAHFLSHTVVTALLVVAARDAALAVLDRGTARGAA